jgi:thiol-disulfide isomerase/thioredoxin
MNAPSFWTNLVAASALVLTLAGALGAADQSTIRAVLLPAKERKAAPDFALKDAAGKTVKLADYRHEIVLLDFWATWCTGCKKELPLFAEFQKAYGAKGVLHAGIFHFLFRSRLPSSLAVVGVSLDDDGWKVVKPFLDSIKAPYEMLLGDDETARRYGIESLPDTFLIDQQGRLAAVYRGGLVDKDDVEAHIKALLSARE